MIASTAGLAPVQVDKELQNVAFSSLDGALAYIYFLGLL